MLQSKITTFGKQKNLPFAYNNLKMNETPPLADRIRLVLSEMDGAEYGKQARLAEIAKCGRPVVHHWLTNKQNTINSKHAMNIASALGYRVEWLMDGRGPPRTERLEIEADVREVRTEPTPSMEASFMIQLSEEELQIITAYRKADAMDRSVMRHLFLKKTDGAGNN